MSADDERFMSLALEQARRALGRTHPNPAVGAVVVKAGRVVATGFHRRAGAPHAEVEALRAAGSRAAGATLYSTLEPCAHQGRTPPCADAIISAGIVRVVCASADPNPLVNGKGLKRLRRSGVTVTTGVLVGEADVLNRPFFKVMRTGLPWVTLKVAITLDGKLATATGDSRWISSEPARVLVHRWRDHVDALIVGAGTVVSDDPLLTTRLPRGGRTPVRVVLDPSLRTPPGSKLYLAARQHRTIVATREALDSARARRLTARGVELWRVPGRAHRLELDALLRRLAADGLLHVFVEGGATLHGELLAAGLFDELRAFIAPKLVGGAGLTWSGGLERSSMPDALQLTVESVERVGGDVLVTAVKTLKTRRLTRRE